LCSEKKKGRPLKPYKADKKKEPKEGNKVWTRTDAEIRVRKTPHSGKRKNTKSWKKKKKGGQKCDAEVSGSRSKQCLAKKKNKAITDGGGVVGCEIVRKAE